MNDCTHGMPTPASCIECMNEGNIERAPRQSSERADSHPFASRHGGHCAVCDLAIIAGVRIVHTTRGRFVHELCVDPL